MFLGDIISEYRKVNKLSLRDFAHRCGLSHSYISALEKNIDPRTNKPIAPTLDTVRYVAIGMNTSIDDILKMLDDNQKFIVNADIDKKHLDLSMEIKSQYGPSSTELLDNYSKLNELGKQNVLQHTKDLTELSKYTEKKTELSDA